MKVPLSGNCTPTSEPEYPTTEDVYIMNPYAGRELLTLMEALDLLNIVTGEMLADGDQRTRG